MFKSTFLGVLVAPVLCGIALAQASQQQVITYSAADSNNFSGWTNCYTCYCSPQQRTPTPGGTLDMTFTDTIGHSYVSIQIEVGWAVNCVGSTSAYSVSLNSNNLGAGTAGTTSCQCYYPNAGATVTQTFTLQPGNTNYVPNGTNILRFTQTGSNYQFGIMNTTSNWCVRLTITGLNQTPPVPQNVHQAADSGGSPQPVGYVSNSTIYFRGRVTDPDAGDELGLQAEILPAATPFAAGITGTLVSTPSANYVPNGSFAEALLDFSTTSLPSGAYHWRVRTIDPIGATSPWVVFDPATTHFTTDFAPPTTPAGPYSPNNVQLVNLSTSAQIPFSWGVAADTAGPPVPIGYRLEISLAQNFSTLVHDSIVSTLASDVTLNASADPYYWRVSAVDQAGNQSLPSSTSIFMLSWTIPEVKTDKYASCGASQDGGSPVTLSLAAAFALLGVLSMRRRAA